MPIDYFVDSSAWIEYFKGGDKGRLVKEFIEDSKSLSVTAIAIAEISDKFSRENKESDEAIKFVLLKSKVVDIAADTAVEAGKFKNERRKKIKNFGLADALIYLVSKRHESILITCDSDFKDLGGVKFIP